MGGQYISRNSLAIIRPGWLGYIKMLFSALTHANYAPAGMVPLVEICTPSPVYLTFCILSVQVHLLLVQQMLKQENLTPSVEGLMGH